MVVAYGASKVGCSFHVHGDQCGLDTFHVPHTVYVLFPIIMVGIIPSRLLSRVLGRTGQDPIK